MSPGRPAILYYGGKWRLYPWLAEHFPPHRGFIDLFGGGGSVLLRKPRVDFEIFNDIDEHVVNFFTVLRDRPDELIRAIRYTPYARTELDRARAPADGDPLETARRFFVSAHLAISKSPFSRNSGWSSTTHVDQRYSPHAATYWRAIGSDNLDRVARRFMGVQIENRDWRYILERYDYWEHLVYADPPYLAETRANPNTYAHEWDVQEHRDFAVVANGLESKIVVSGYQSPLYDEIYEDWYRFDRQTKTGGGDRVESIWLSPATYDALHYDYSDLPIFGVSS